MMFKWLFIWLVTMLTLSQVVAQQPIVGTVKDAATGNPIAGASIFINNTTYGTSSSGKGSFVISSLPYGKYEVVVSAMGYHTYVAEIGHQENQSVHLQVNLNVKPALLEEVEIMPFEKDGWERWGKLFLETFIGTSPNAAQTKLVNHEVIRFRHNKAEGYLEAIALEPLHIENKSLGYTLEYVLENCRIDFKNRMSLLFGYPHFQEMEAGRSRQRRFEKRRMETYNTSLMRFMRSLYRGTLDEDGYEVRRMERKPNTEKQRVLALRRSLYQAVWDSTRQLNVTRLTPTGTYTADSLAYFEKVTQEPDELVTIFPHLLKEDSLLNIDADGKKRLAFSDFLHIRNRQLLEHQAYLEYLNESRKPDVQTAMLSMVGYESIQIESNGGYFPPQGIFIGWYWAWCDRLADLLPLDYALPVKD